LLKAAIRDNDPVLFMESERMYGDKGEIPDGEYLLPIGVADIKRAGKDVTIVSFGKMMKVALGAAEELAEGRHRCRGDRPAHHPPDGPCHHPEPA
jgi:pyruvate dehydrogenase E1 component beta subunit